MKYIEQFMKVAVIFNCAAMILVVALQVISRFALPSAPPWTEEAARFFYIYAVSCAAGFAVKEKAFVGVDTLHHFLPYKIRVVLVAVIHIVIALFMLVMSVYTISFIRLGHLQRSPSLQIPMSFIFISIFIMSVSILLYSIIEFYKLVKKQGV